MSVAMLKKQMEVLEMRNRKIEKDYLGEVEKRNKEKK
jgi:hypothetical protein